MKKLFFLPALAAMMFSSCSSDEPTVDNPADQTGNKYMSVKIRNVGGSGSRAESYEVGVGNENTITAGNIRFYFFTADGRPFVMNSAGVSGTVSNTNMVAPTTINASSTTDGAVTDIQATLVLGTPTEPYSGNRPAYVFCVANPTSSFAFTNFANKRMSEIYNIGGNAPTDLDAEDTFVMTSSTYADNSFNPAQAPFATGSKVIFFADLKDKIFDTPEAAKSNPAEIYLERLAAKVRAHGLTTYTAQQKAADNTTLSDAVYTIKVLQNGAIVPKTGNKLDVELTGWKLRNVANTAYGVKHIENDWLTNAPFTGWNITELHRSFWAVSKAASTNDVERKDYHIEIPAEFALGNYDAAKPTENIAYCYENNMVQPASVTDRPTDATAMVVRGVVKMQGETTPLNLCFWGGDYFTEEALKQQIIETYNADKNDADKLTAAAVGFAKDTRATAKSNTWYAYVQVGANQVHNNYRFNDIKRWVNGETSYYVNIEHMGGKFGVIRNHIYDYTFSNVIGLGVPGNDPKNPDPETKTYLAARVMVLNWHLLSNNIVLE